jgi:hypothetical protein
MAVPQPPAHRWYTPEDCAALLGAVRHGEGYRAPCPVHGGDSTDCLSIRLGRDQYGNPMTWLHCFAHDCPRAAICAEMGIEVKQLYAIQPAYAKATRSLPRAKSPRIARLAHMDQPTPDEIAQLLLEEMIVADPAFLETCPPARQKMWALAHASPQARAALTRALVEARYIPSVFWQQLATEQGS